jgi:predicted RNase H-like HicB family nuclease
MTMNDEITRYLSLPYTFDIAQTPDGSFHISVEELDGCMASGDTLEDAYEMLRYDMHGWIDQALSEGRDIPQPRSFRD